VNIRLSHARWWYFLALALLPLRALGQAPDISILQQPASISNATLGQRANFSVHATPKYSTNALYYQWRRNGVNIPGAVNTNYTVSNVQGTNTGAYTVVVGDGIETVTSSTATLTADISVLVGDILNLVSVTNGTVRASNVGVEVTGAPVIIPNNGGHPVTFKWTPLYSGIVTFTTEGSDFETIMGAYTGSTGSLLQVPSAVNGDDSGAFHSSQISFNAQGLTEYSIVVDGYNGASGNIVLSWSEEVTSGRLATFSLFPPPETDASNGAPYSFATAFSSGSLLWYFNGAPTTVSTATYPISQVNDATVGTYVAKVTSAGGNVTATRAADLQTAVLEDGSTPTNSFAWKHFSDAARSPYSKVAPQGARKLSGGGDSRGFSVSQTFSTVGAVSEPGEPVVADQIGGAPEWYVYVTPTNGTMEIDTDGSDFNTILGVFTGPGNSFLTLTMTSNGAGYTTNYHLEPQPQVFVPVTAHQTNYIVVDGELGVTGTVHLHINVGTSLVMSTPPTNEAVLQGDNATFSVTATGTTPISYFWLLGGTNIPGATNSTLIVTNVQPAQQGSYTVIVSNAVSTVITNALLSLLYPPSITNQPQSQEIVAGGTATFTNLASGTPPLSFQWLNGNQAILNETNTTLTFNPVTTDQAGSYSCVVTNVAGAVTSSVVTLTVDTLPVIIIPPASQTVASNAQVTLTNTASGLPAPAYAWYFDGVANGVSTSSLLLTNFQPSQQGTYFVVVSNRAGAVTSSPAFLALNQPLRAGQLMLTNGVFQFQFIGSMGSNYVVQASTNLTNWVPLFTNIATNGYVSVTDTNAASFPGRYYRTVGQ